MLSVNNVASYVKGEIDSLHLKHPKVVNDRSLAVATKAVDVQDSRLNNRLYDIDLTSSQQAAVFVKDCAIALLESIALVAPDAGPFTAQLRRTTIFFDRLLGTDMRERIHEVEPTRSAATYLRNLFGPRGDHAEFFVDLSNVLNG